MRKITEIVGIDTNSFLPKLTFHIINEDNSNEEFPLY